MPRVKRKYDNTPPTLGEGPPTLQRFGVSETGPSIPKDKDHQKITSAVVKEIGLLGDETFEEIKDYRTRFDLRDGIVSYITENDVAKLVERYLTSVLDAMGLLDTVGVYSKVGTFKLRPDLWIITVRSRPVGVVEVKKPDKRGQKFLALEHPNVLGELYDFMKHLPNFYGTYPAFGILTNMNSWRFAWLPDEETIYWRLHLRNWNIRKITVSMKMQSPLSSHTSSWKKTSQSRTMLLLSHRMKKQVAEPFVSLVSSIEKRLVEF